MFSLIKVHAPGIDGMPTKKRTKRTSGGVPFLYHPPHNHPPDPSLVVGGGSISLMEATIFPEGGTLCRSFVIIY